MIKPADTATTPSQLIADCRDAIKEQLDKIEHNRYGLKVPAIHGRMQAVRNSHFHLYPEFFLQLGGITEMVFPREKLNLHPRSICLIPPGLPHAETARAYQGPFLNMVAMFQPETMSFHLAHQGPGHRPRLAIIEYFATPLAARTREYMESIIAASWDDNPDKKILIKGLLLACLSTMLLVLAGKSMAWAKEHEKISHTRQLVRSNLFDHTLSVRKLAEWLQCSADYLSFLFRNQTGTHLTAYINQQRVQHARHLLESTTSTVSEIAWASGYYDPSYFIRVFKRTTGKTPKAYRKPG